jgi:hypothetical protein
VILSRRAMPGQQRCQFSIEADVCTWHEFSGWLVGRARQLCPGISDLNLLCDLKSIIDLDTQIANGALYLGVP